MYENLLLILALLFVVMLLVMLAQKIHIAYPIFLVLVGLGQKGAITLGILLYH